jgi:hypothetical protein
MFLEPIREPKADLAIAVVCFGFRIDTLGFRTVEWRWGNEQSVEMILIETACGTERRPTAVVVVALPQWLLKNQRWS